jgi:hypothetical protein
MEESLDVGEAPALGTEVDLEEEGDDGSDLSNGCRFVSSTLLSQHPMSMCVE